MKDLSEAKKVLVMEIKRDSKGDKVSSTQMGVFEEVLQFNINGGTKSVSQLLAPLFKLKANISQTTIEECENLTHVPYASEVGCLMYAMVYTRPDLS